MNVARIQSCVIFGYLVWQIFLISFLFHLCQWNKVTLIFDLWPTLITQVQVSICIFLRYCLHEYINTPTTWHLIAHLCHVMFNGMSYMISFFPLHHRLHWFYIIIVTSAASKFQDFSAWHGWQVTKVMLSKISHELYKCYWIIKG